MKTNPHSSFALAALALFVATLPAPAQTNWGSALSFDGVDDYAACTRPVADDFTLECWLRTTNTSGSGSQWYFGTGLIDSEIGGTNNDFGLTLCGGRALFGTGTLGPGRTNDVTIQSGVIADGTWHHVAATRQKASGLMQLYVDGEPVGSGTNGTNSLNARLDMRLGSLATGTNCFRGEMDDVRIWNVARTQSEIQTAMSRPLTGNESNLVAYYRMDEVSGIRVCDATTNRYHGTLNNRPLRVPSRWSPTLSINGANPYTNECHSALVDPGATASAAPMAVAGGYQHSLGLKADGTVIAWGNGSIGQTNCPANATNVIRIAAGYNHNLALRANGTVIAWGDNSHTETNTPTDLTNVVDIAGGGFHSVALRADGTVASWGWYGAPTGLTNVVAIAAGGQHSLALLTDGTVVGWGDTTYGQTNPPAGLSNVVDIAAGWQHSVALKADGTVIVWGDNSQTQTNTPAGLSNVVAIAASYFHSLALKADGTIVGWGGNWGGLSIPAGLSNVMTIAAGAYHGLALQSDGTVVGWGDTTYGQAAIPANLSKLTSLVIAVSGAMDTNTPASYELTYSTTNGLGAVGSATRTVVVVDTLPPVLTLLGDNPLIHLVGTAFVEPGATATDLCHGDLTASIVSNLTVNTTILGTYTNTFTVTDAGGNAAFSNRTVVVEGPLAVTLPASGITGAAATLNGTVLPGTLTATAWFEWGTTTNTAASRPQLN
jgi:alpha-tubulin suppressor-like RCC1 family protein